MENTAEVFLPARLSPNMRSYRNFLLGWTIVMLLLWNGLLLNGHAQAWHLPFLLIVILCDVYYLWQRPEAFLMRPNALEIPVLLVWGSPRRIPYDQITGVEPTGNVDGKEVFGLRRLRKAFLRNLVTNASSAVLISTSSARRWLVSPTDPEGFAHVLRLRVPHAALA